MAFATGFLLEPEPGCVAHTAFSKPFVTKPFYLDAAMFLTQTAVPMSLQMPRAIQKAGQTAYSMMAKKSFPSACNGQTAKLSHQWNAYLSHAMGVEWGDRQVLDVLRSSRWAGWEEGVLVDAAAQSVGVGVAIATEFPQLQVVVQVTVPARKWKARAGQVTPRSAEIPAAVCGRVSVQPRSPGVPQTVEGAAVYLIHVPHPAFFMGQELSMRQMVAAELGAHIGVLASKPRSRLVIAGQGLLLGLDGAEGVAAEPGESSTSRVASALNLTLLQLGAGPGSLAPGELADLISSVQHRAGRLVVVDQQQNAQGATIALLVAFEAYGGGGPSRAR